MQKIILASTSPRRKDILLQMGLQFEVVPSSYEEVLDSPAFGYEKIENLAYNKAKVVADLMDDSVIVLGADTVVVLDEQILGKPKDEQDAIAMLKSLSGKVHFVVTSICAINSETLEKTILSTTSYVEFEELATENILDYVKRYKPLDKAGSYGIQELPAGFVKNITGSFENIVGLCPLAVAKVLKKND